MKELFVSHGWSTDLRSVMVGRCLSQQELSESVWCLVRYKPVY